MNNHNRGKPPNRGASNAHLDEYTEFGLYLWDTGFGCSRTKER